MDIKQLIGETTDYDKKLALEEKKPKSWCKSISAFANCFGGKLIFGVSNDNELVGLADAEGDAEKISEAIKTHLNPIPEFKLYFEKYGEKIFVIVEVMKGQQTPYYYEGDGQLIAFMRIGNESVPATPSQLRELVLRGSGESYDSLKSRYDFDNMSFTKLKSVYKQRTGNTFEDTDYESFGLIDERGNLTNAGALLADESPVRHSRLFCTRWNGLTKASGIVDALDDKEYTGSLVTLLQAGTDFVRNNSVPVLVSVNYDTYIDYTYGWYTNLSVNVIDMNGNEYTEDFGKYTGEDKDDELIKKADEIIKNGTQKYLDEKNDGLVNDIKYIAENAESFKECEMKRETGGWADYGERYLYLLYGDEYFELGRFGGEFAWLDNEEIQQFVTKLVENNLFADKYSFEITLEYMAENTAQD